MKERPYIGHILPRAWGDATGRKIEGLTLVGANGIAAHLTRPEAYELANRIVDAAEQLPEPRNAPKRPTPPQPAYAPRTRALTAADGTEEPRLPATPAD